MLTVNLPSASPDYSTQFVIDETCISSSGAEPSPDISMQASPNISHLLQEHTFFIIQHRPQKRRVIPPRSLPRRNTQISVHHQPALNNQKILTWRKQVIKPLVSNQVSRHLPKSHQVFGFPVMMIIWRCRHLD